MNRKITNKIVLIISTFLILSSSLFAQISGWAIGFLYTAIFIILYLGVLIVLPLIIIIVIINFISQKRNLIKKHSDYYALIRV
ncbi:hypothetical protein [Brachyspira sp.]|uniref:hypothetical protein n=1 Tax=Brachyspira sp. TaxID=1977261 RepID=UPI003D7C5E32